MRGESNQWHHPLRTTSTHACGSDRSTNILLPPRAKATYPPQAVQQETRRVVRRKVVVPCGREGVEFVDEHQVVYAAPTSVPPAADPVRSTLAGFFSFIATALVFSAAGGGEQSFIMAPVYLFGFLLLWAWLA